MFVTNLIARVESGELTIDAARAKIGARKSEYTKPSIKNIDKLIEWHKRCEELKCKLRSLTQEIVTDNNSTSVLNKGQVFIAAAWLLGSESQGMACFTTGYQLWSLGNFEEALNILEQASRLLLEHDIFFSTSAKSFFLDCLLKIHRYDDAVVVAEDLIQLSRDQKFEGIEALALRDLGTSQSNLGKHDQAIRTLEKALKLRQRLSREVCEEQAVTSEATFYRAIALATRSKGKFKSALGSFEEARRIYLKEGDKREAAYMLSEIGITWDYIGERKRAINHCATAAQEAEKLGMTEEAARWRSNMPAFKEKNSIGSFSKDPYTLLVQAKTLLEADSPQPSKALTLARQCIREAKRLGELQFEVEARNLLAGIHSDQGNLFQALLAIQAAIGVIEKLNNPVRELQLRTNLANILSRLDRYTEAEEQYRRALEMGRTIRGATTTTELRQATGAGLARVYEQLAFLLTGSWETKEGSRTKSRPEELLRLGQEIRSVNLASWMVGERELETESSDDLREKFLELRAVDVHLEMAAFAGKPETKVLMETQAKALKEFKMAVARENQQVTLESPIVSVEEISEFLEPDECLVDLFSISEGIILTQVSYDQGLKSDFCRWERKERLEFMRHWESAVVGRNHTSQGGQSSSQTKESATVALLTELEERFIKDIARLLEKVGGLRRVFIVPHRELFQLPFWGVTKYIPDLRISIIPGTNVLGLLRERHRNVAGHRLALGDVTGTLKHACSEINSLPKFHLLPESISQIFQELTGASLLHFAGHGEFNAEHPYLSGLVVEKESTGKLGPFDARTPFDEGLLTVAQMLARGRMPHCFLVTLSACSTGIPRNHPASEFISLPTAFLIAGARNVIASLWPINDGAARLIMQTFYDFFLSGDEIINPPSLALAEARQAVSKMPRQEVIERLGSERGVPQAETPYASPAYTMAFEHFGVD